jgi:hypothetical protein
VVRERLLHGARVVAPEGEGGARPAKGREAAIVGLVLGVADMRDDLGSRAAQMIDAADVVDVALGQDDVARGIRIELGVVLLVIGRLEEHARVDDDAALGRRDQKAVREALGEMDEVVDRLGPEGRGIRRAGAGFPERGRIGGRHRGSVRSIDRRESRFGTGDAMPR